MDFTPPPKLERALEPTTPPPLRPVAEPDLDVAEAPTDPNKKTPIPTLIPVASLLFVLITTVGGLAIWQANGKNAQLSNLDKKETEGNQADKSEAAGRPADRKAEADRQAEAYRQAALQPALANKDWAEVLRRDPKNKQALAWKAAADRQAEVDRQAELGGQAERKAALETALAAKDWAKALTLDPDNQEGLAGFRLAARQEAHQKLKPLMVSHWTKQFKSGVIALQPFTNQPTGTPWRGNAGDGLITSAIDGRSWGISDGLNGPLVAGFRFVRGEKRTGKLLFQWGAGATKETAELVAAGRLIGQGVGYRLELPRPANTQNLAQKMEANRKAALQTAVQTALAASDWSEVLRLDPKNKEGLARKKEAERQAANKKLTPLKVRNFKAKTPIQLKIYTQEPTTNPWRGNPNDGLTVATHITKTGLWHIVTADKDLVAGFFWNLNTDTFWFAWGPAATKETAGRVAAGILTGQGQGYRIVMEPGQPQ